MLSFCVCLEITQSLTVCLQYFVLLLLCFEDCLEDPFRRVQTVLSSKRGFFREAFDTVHFYIAIIYCIYIPTKCTYTVEYIYIVYQIHKTRVLLEDGAVCAETCRRYFINDNIHNYNIVQSKHNNIYNDVKFATCFGYSNHHQADISVHGHDMFSAYSMGSHIATTAV